VGELAEEVGLNAAATSRIVQALKEDAFVRVASSPENRRKRVVHLERPIEMLGAWLPLWARRRMDRRHWDIGARDAEEAMGLLRDAWKEVPGGWAIGGLAGAAMIRRAVEPAEVLVWAGTEATARLTDLLQPLSARPAPGNVRVWLAPDPWTLGLSALREGLPVADLAQLWLDCSSEGERALEAADAVANAAGWL